MSFSIDVPNFIQIATILNFTNSVILAPSDPPTAISIRVPNLMQMSSLATEIWPKNNSRCNFLDFQKMLFCVPSMDNAYPSKFDASIFNSDWCNNSENWNPSWILPKVWLWAPVTVVWQYLSAYQIWCNCLHWRPNRYRKSKSKTRVWACSDGQTDRQTVSGTHNNGHATKFHFI